MRHRLAPRRWRGASASGYGSKVTFKDHFSAHAGDYATFRPTYPAQLATYLGSLSRSHTLAWDVGCGTGQLSTLLAEQYAEVVATDASAEQVAKATPHPKVIYAARPCERSGLDAGSADLVTVAQAAHWFDLPAFYEEVRRVAKADGAIALITYGITAAEGRLGELIDAFYHRVVGAYWPFERAHVENGYRDLPFPFDELQAPPMAMRARWNAEQLLGYVSTWSAVRPARKALGDEPFERFERDVRAEMDGAAREIRWPLAMRVGKM